MSRVASIPDIVQHFGDCPADDRGLLWGIPVTAMERTLADLVLDNDRESAISILDSALAHRRISSMDRVREAVAGRHGVGARRAWFDLVDGRSESPLETRLRLMLTDGGLPPEELQWPVKLPDLNLAGLNRGNEDGRGLDLGPEWDPRRNQGLGPGLGPPVAWLDLAWPSCLVAVEADGVAFHDKPRALLRDRIRQNALLSRGWRLLRFTWSDVLNRAGYVLASVERMLRGSPSRTAVRT